MEAKCPRCAAVFSTERNGLQYCPSCGGAVEVAPPAGGRPTQPPVEASPPPPTSGPAPPAAAIPGGPGAPPPPGSPLLSGRGPTPWERRDEIGLIPALFDTWRQSLFDPDVFWRNVRPNAAAGDALFYGWIVAAVAALLQIPLAALSLGIQGAQLRAILSEMKDVPEPFLGLMRFFFGGGGSLMLLAAGTAASILLYPLGLIIRAAFIHLGCLVFGAARHGFWATFRVLGYAEGPMIFQFVPCVGVLAFLYTLVLDVIGIARVQETTVGRAAAAVLLLPALACCCGVGVAFFALAAIIRVFTGH